MLGTARFCVVCDLIVCRRKKVASAFTVFPLSTLFRVMQRLFFYRFSSCNSFSGNARAFLLPFFFFRLSFGQSRGFSFTVFLLSTLFRAMQRLFFYRFDLVPELSGNGDAIIYSLCLVRAACSISSNLLTLNMFILGQANREYRGRDGFLCLWNGLIG